jgi:hypothetical protein
MFSISTVAQMLRSFGCFAGITARVAACAAASFDARIAWLYFSSLLPRVIAYLLPDPHETRQSLLATIAPPSIVYAL